VEQNEWFDKMKQLTDELHKLSHEPPQSGDPARDRLMEVVGAACDVLLYITGTSSWDTRQPQDYDKLCIKEEIKQVLMWHLR
jgi:hypothetical protein